MHVASAVKRDLMLGYVHVAHDLDSCDYRTLRRSRHGEHLTEHTVNPHADIHRRFARLKVDIRAVLVHGILKKAVDQSNRRCGILTIGADDVRCGDILKILRRVVFRAAQLLQRLLRSLRAVQVGDNSRYRIR